MILEKARYSLEQAVAKYSKVTLYGLNYNVNLENLVNRNMIIKALDYDDESNNSYLSTTDREKLLSKISIPLGGKNCSTC